jgi:hypothetical protein
MKPFAPMRDKDYFSTLRVSVLKTLLSPSSDADLPIRIVIQNKSHELPREVPCNDELKMEPAYLPDSADDLALGGSRPHVCVHPGLPRT